MMTHTIASFAVLLQGFFTQRLMQQRQASPHTISSYRDTFRMLLKFVHQRSHTPPAQLASPAIDARDTFRMLLKFAHQQLLTPPAQLALQAIDAPLIVRCLDHLEKPPKLSMRC